MSGNPRAGERLTLQAWRATNLLGWAAVALVTPCSTP